MWRPALSHIRRLSQERRGSVTVITAIAVTALIGLAALGTDVGRLYIARQRVGAAADAAALSGAQFLPEDRAGAVDTVRTYLTKNGITSDEVTLILNETDRTIAVYVQHVVSFTFAKVLGHPTGTVTASAVAKTANLSGYDNVAPLAVVRQDWQLGAPVVLKASPGSGGHISSGNYGALALGGNGANSYEQNLQHGYDHWVRVGDQVTTQPGDIVGPTERAIRYRISQDPDVNHLTVRKGSPRVVIIPVIDTFTGNGRDEMKVAGFAAFFLESIETQGNDRGTIRGRFLRYVVPGEAEEGADEFATYTIKLSQ